jgi:glycine dehydrogenase subunit 1
MSVFSPFTPHTDTDVQSMLDAIGVENIDALFSEIPESLRFNRKLDVPEGLSEIELNHLVAERTKSMQPTLSFMGAGAYEHHIPAAVWDITSRGEYLTAYTPYQAEASQGTLQLLYEYQSMIAALMGMDVSNASMYDGASALAEAALMAARIQSKQKNKRLLIVGTLHPHYLETLRSIVVHQGLEIIVSSIEDIPENTDPFTAVILQQPSFLGTLEDVDRITNWAHAHGALLIAVVNPISLGLLKEPGAWGSIGSKGADIACGEGQPLGIPLASGGPYFGFLSCRQEYVRQMPGRIIGRTVDTDGKPGFALTLQAREQHIRRSKATSNICTNQGLMTTAATIYMSLLGPQGLEATAKQCHKNTRLLVEKLTSISGVKRHTQQPFFHECVIDLPRPASEVLKALLAHDIAGGIDLGQYYPELSHSLLVCATETKTQEDLTHYANVLEKILADWE